MPKEAHAFQAAHTLNFLLAALCIILFFVGVGGAPGRSFGEEHDGKVARRVRVPHYPPNVVLQALFYSRSSLFPVIFVPLPRAAATASLAADGVNVGRMLLAGRRSCVGNDTRTGLDLPRGRGCGTE